MEKNKLLGFIPVIATIFILTFNNILNSKL